MQNQAEKKASSGLLEIYILSCFSFNVFFYDKNQWRAGKGFCFVLFFFSFLSYNHQFITNTYRWLQTIVTSINPLVYVRSIHLFMCQIRQKLGFFFDFPHSANILTHFWASLPSRSLLWLLCWFWVLFSSAVQSGWHWVETNEEWFLNCQCVII